MKLYSALARPVLFALDPERAHDLTMAALRSPMAPPILAMASPGTNPQLQQSLFGLAFSNPVGLAAGLDKHGTAVRSWAALGFGFAEIGTVTPRPQPGNPKPRLFRLRGDRAIINRFGFNSVGAAQVATNLSRSGCTRASVNPGERPGRCLVGINLGKNKDTPNERAVDDYVMGLDVLHRFADYFVVNVSSPNTAGLRALQDRKALRPLVEQVVGRLRQVATRAIPVLVKVSPDLEDDELVESVEAALAGGASGVIATNTTTGRSGLVTGGPIAQETGGLSGAPLRDRANRACRTLYRHLGGRVPIVGVGGIFTASDAYERIRSGAALVQLYTGLVYQGPAIVSGIRNGLAERLRRDGLTSVSEAVGIDVH